MRTTLFLPTLLAVTLAGGAALAEKAGGPIGHLRAHGDSVDKTYRATAERHATLQGGPQRVEAPSHPTFDAGASRVSCSENGVDCPHRGGRASVQEASAGQTGRAARAPAFLDKVLGSDRTNFNEAGESQGMSARAAKRAWSHVGAGGASGATMPLARQQQHLRAGEQASSNRMACNDADECMMSSKGVKKEWAYRSVKAGTWKGPEAPAPAAAAPPPVAAPSGQVVITGRPTTRATKGETTKHEHEQ